MRFVGNLPGFQQCKNFKNLLRIDKVIAMSLVYYFLGHSVDSAKSSAFAQLKRVAD